MSESITERGDGPAQAVLRANAEKQVLRQAMETQEELQKIKDRVCFTLSAYEIGEELREENENNLEEIKDAFVKDDTELQFVDDMANLYLILSDPIAKRKYQQKVTIFVVGYENLCTTRHKLLSQIQDFFKQNTIDESSLVIDVPEFDLEDVGKNVRDALDKAEKTTERLASVSQEIMKLFDVINPKDHKKGKKKLEKALYQSQQDIMNLTEKLVGVQTDLVDSTNKLNTLTKQIETKDIDIEKLKLQVNRNKGLAVESDNFKKALEAKEQQLQNCITQMEEAELALSQAENKYDNYIENNKKLKEENEQLFGEIQTLNKGHQQTMIDTRKELEQKYDEQVQDLKQTQEEITRKLKDSHGEEIKMLKEKLNVMRWSSANKSQLTTPTSADSAVSRLSTVTTEYSVSLKSTATIVKTAQSLKDSVSRGNTAVSSADSALETSQNTLFISQNNTPLPSTPKTAETLKIGTDLRDVSAQKRMLENSTQTEDIFDEISEERDLKSRHDLEKFEIELAKTPSDELPDKLEEYKNKFMEVQQELEEEIFQWKLRFNSKSEALNQLFVTHQNEMQKKEEIVESLASVQERLVQAEKEAEEAILQLEELQAAREFNVTKTPMPSYEISTVDRATSASQLNENQVTKEDRLQSPGDLFDQQSVAIQCPSTSDIVSSLHGDNSMPVEDGDTGIQPSDSGFDGIYQMSLNVQIEEKSKQAEKSVPSSPRVRSRLVRSALKDHQVITETIKIFEMVTEFKLNIVYWLQENGLESDTITTIPEIALVKNDELDVLSKLPAIRDYIKKLLEVLCEMTMNKNSIQNQEDEERMRRICDIYDVDVISPTTDGHSSSTRTLSACKRITSGRNLRARSMQTDRLISPSSARTTPKGYTHLLHEYNNLNEQYLKLEQEQQNIAKKHQQEISQNAVVMNEMQELINNLKLQLLDNKQERVSSVMFTRLDAERNVKTMKRALQAKRIPPHLYGKAVSQMNCYIELPGRRFADLVRRYHHHCYMKEIEENLCPTSRTSSKVYAVQERMEELQRERAQRWSEKMAELGEQRSLLSDEITSSLNKIEESSGIFLIKPIYSYSSRPQQTQKTSHPIICKKQQDDNLKKPSGILSKSVKKTTNEENTVNYGVQNGQMWNFKQSQESESIIAYNNIPKLLAMDVNQMMLTTNPVSVYLNHQTSSERLAGVRQYVTVERPIGHQFNDVHFQSRTITPPLSHYETLPPINLPSPSTQQSLSSLSSTSEQKVPIQ